MKLSDYDYDLPDELIAQEPLADRNASRMLTVDRSSGALEHRRFSELPTFLRHGDVLVLNNTKVFPARLLGRSETGAQVEVFLVCEIKNDVWEALARPARRLPKGKRIVFSDDLSAEVIERRPDGSVIVRFEHTGSFADVLDRVGRTPLPPYIKRDEGRGPDDDRVRYQTVFAKHRGSIAAPTAGLHFTPDVIEAIKNNGVEVVEMTLHVGYGTFEPVRVDDLKEHRVSPEIYEIDTETADRLKAARSDGRRIIAVGTTTTRALETTITRDGKFTAGRFAADLTIVPGYKFKAVDALLTNFHLPKSSLLVLVSTFTGHELIMKAYEHAVADRYRFYSYGDCMFIA
ncbi:MAG TPA: tRNA preQ1(34) S-adenosylmethionine ribosyltransferase-isomerase QueA [Pyrinomonadaceae bacterium]|jgi:S-adenosylmethionine:tRNA ribosyltransferase-isomerase